MSQKGHIKRLITNYNRRLEKLKEQQALYGASADPQILLQIEDIEAKIEILQTELKKSKDVVEPPPITPGGFYGESQRDRERGTEVGFQAGERSGGVNINSSSVTVGGDVVGGDKVVYGNSVAMTGISGKELDELFKPLMSALQNIPPEKRDEALQKAEALKSEVAKGKAADDSLVAGLVDGLVALVPSGVSAIVSMFASPILAGIAGPVTTFVLGKIQANSQ